MKHRITAITFVATQLTPDQVQIGSDPAATMDRFKELEDNSMINVVAPELFNRKRPPRFTIERDRFLLDNKDVSSAILANQMGLSESFVIMYQRKLGIRPFATNRKHYGAKSYPL
jgi:hypothetical protein